MAVADADRVEELEQLGVRQRASRSLRTWRCIVTAGPTFMDGPDHIDARPV
ncbi:hypothetical protein [Amnibacterium kyonggiense]|uniref:hypothetical protein n=1 Tax=Amnibacterium kyonggiense TaxID=595671 RepID=UPI0013C2B783|nr:hypothetical protein [Amnibacterium kyonggiense]